MEKIEDLVSLNVTEMMLRQYEDRILFLLKDRAKIWLTDKYEKEWNEFSQFVMNRRRNES